MEEKKPQSTSPLTILIALAAALVILNMLFLYFIVSETKTIRLMRQQKSALAQDRQILSSAQDIYTNYQKEIDAINAVFPNEESISTFIQALEDKLRATSDTYSVKFSSLTPLVEGDKQYLLLILTMKTDLVRLERFFDELEHFPYMTHIVSLNSNTPDAFVGSQEITVGIKVYVQNPFTN